MQMADALKYYYWALSLLRGHPDGSSIEITDKQGKQKLLVAYLPSQINDIFASLNFYVTNIEKSEGFFRAVIGVQSNGKPAANLDYSY